LPDGRYSLSAQAVDRVGLKDRQSKGRVIDTRPPRFRWHTEYAAKFSTTEVMPEYEVREARPPVRIALHLRGRHGRSITFRRHRAHSSAHFVPRDRRGRRLLAGKYSLGGYVQDAAGNRRRLPRKVIRYVPPTGTRTFSRIERAGRRVALTFDDCNYVDAWDDILDTLHRHGLTASFFCPGQVLLSRTEQARRTYLEGHDVGAHGWDHALLTSHSYSDIVWRLKGDMSSWWKTAGDVAAPYFRPPYGGYNSTVLRAAADTGYERTVMWDVDSLDTQTSSPSEIAHNVIRDARPGSIVLMHVKPGTAAALPSILAGLRDRDLHPVSLTSLFRHGGYK
jgi:peptidoglycan/xylan/chitin deacetylase (PgdA/CDA1 family)